MIFTDWEGPWVLTDFAYECAIAFFNSHEFFERLSQYDDYLVLVEKRKDYEAGDTLRLLAVFLVANDVSSEELRDLAEKVLKPTPDAETAIKKLKETPVVISTSYEQFLEVSAKYLGVEKHIYCTKFKPESYRLNSDEKEAILEAVEVIANLPEITIPPDKRAKDAINWLNDFFWNRLQKTGAKRILDEVKAIGGKRKLEVVLEYGVEKPIVIGDSISDKDMLAYAKENGIAIAFNGNEFALSNSTLAVISQSALGEVEVVNNCLESGLNWINEVTNVTGGKVYRLDRANLEDVLKESKAMRAKLRGLAGYLS
jgi:predicted HAD superfamily phosphohydrolase